MVYVLKFGGNAIRGKSDLDRLSREIAFMIENGHEIVLVHGGGPEINEELEKRNIVPKKVGGQRVTDDKTLEVVIHVLEQINKDVVASLKEVGVNAQRLAGYDVIRCRKKESITVLEGGKTVTADLGKVGDVESVDTAPILDMLNKGITPVIFPVSSGPEGKYNVNADTASGGIAAALKCEEMIQITDVPGILMNVKDPKSKLDHVTLNDIEELIKSGVISGGMIPKVEACKAVIDAGVEKVRMVNGKDEHSIITDILKDIPHGTLITR
jgi:acetylglutamate kinase